MSRPLQRRIPHRGPLVLALLAGLAGRPDVARAEAGRAPITLSPAGKKLRLRVGQTQHFTVVGERILCFWRMDGHTISGALPEWSFTPTPSQVGRHRLTVDVHQPAGLAHRAWVLRVDPPRPPRVVGVAPEAPALEIAADEPVELSLATRPGAAGERVHTAWSVDGVPAGEGETLRFVPARTGTIRARALATGSLGSAVAREWEITVRPTVLAAATPTTLPAPPTTVPAPVPVPTTTVPVPLPTTTVPAPRPTITVPPPSPTTTVPAPPPAPTTTTPTIVATTTTSVALPRTTTTSLPRLESTTTTTPVALAAVSTTTTTLPESPNERLASLPPPPEPPPAAPAPPSRDGITRQDVRLLLQRYAAAWNRHDVDELRRLGQVATEQQADALRDYFGRVADLEVEVELLDLSIEGDRHTVRFTRRDRFRDPGGRIVSKETPPIEKEVVRSGGSLRFASPQR